MKKALVKVVSMAMALGCAIGFASCGAKKDEKKVQYIGCQSGTTAQYFIDGDEDWEFDGLANYSSKGFSNAGLAATALKNKQVSYVITDQAPAVQIASSISGLKVINVPLTEEEYAFGVDKGQATLLAQINEVLATMVTNGKYAEIMESAANGTLTSVSSATKDLAKADKQLVVATNAEFAPFEYMEGDKFCGIDIAFCAYIAEQLNMELVIENMDFDAVVTSVGKNGVDIAAAALTVNDTRKESVNFTTSYYNAAQVLITVASDTTFDACKTAEEVVAILNGTEAK